MSYTILRYNKLLLLKLAIIFLLPLLLISCMKCRNDDAPAPPPAPEILLIDAESKMNIIKNSEGEGIYPVDQIRFFDSNKNEVSLFEISDDGILVYFIPPYVNERDARYTYYMELEPGLQIEFELAHYYQPSDCFGYLISRIEMEIIDNLVILIWGTPVEVYLTL